MNFISEDNVEGVTISLRDAPPSHYIFKIQSFSTLLNSSIDKYDSGEFEIGGYKWKLSLYPNGNKKKNAKDHISLYLTIADSNSLPFGWEVDVSLKLFLLDQIRDKYLTIEESGGKYRRFHGMKMELGFTHLIPHVTFNNPRNGFLVDDTCVFGVEVFLPKKPGTGECLALLKEVPTLKYTWSIEKLSQKEGYFHSEQFTVGDYKWLIRVYPKGDGAKGKNHVSAYIVLADATALPSSAKIYAKISIWVKSQSKTASDINKEAHSLFDKQSLVLGWPKLASHDTLNDHTKGFLIKDTCIVEAEVTVLGLVTPLS